MRSDAADAANRRSSAFITEARKAEIEGLKSASGMTRAQIEAEQFRISQQSYALEQQRKTIQTEILALEDRVYEITELREVRLLEIRNIETIIDGLKSTQLAKAQEELDNLQKRFDAEQAILDAALSKIEEQKLAWESVQIELDEYKLALINSNNELRTMLDLINAIALAMSKLKMPQLTSSGYVPTEGPSPEAQQEADDAAKAAADAEAEAAEAADAATAAALAAADSVMSDVAAIDKVVSSIARTAIVKATNISSLNNAVALAQDTLSPEAISINMARAITNSESMTKAVGGTAAALSAARYTGQAMRYAAMGKSSGGMIKPKYFAVGGPARGTDIVPAMLTPGEFVMSKYAVNSYGVDKMKAINSGSYQGEKVYNYNLSVNVKSDANPEDIARVVMTQIRQVDSQRIRAQRG
jgi:hypothetical protein